MEEDYFRPLRMEQYFEILRQDRNIAIFDDYEELEVEPPYLGQDEIIDLILKKIGLTPRLIEAKEVGVQAMLRSRIPKEKPFGESYGITGGTGLGKSCEIACRIKDAVTSAYIERYDPEEWGGYNIWTKSETNRFYKNLSIQWVYWPDYALIYQDAARDGLDHLDPEYNPMKLKLCKILILDDLGREHAKPDSFSTAHLASIINYRYDHKATTYWSSNLNADALLERYSVPTIDRLSALAPAGKWLKLQSIR